MKVLFTTVLSAFALSNIALGAPAIKDSCRPVASPGPIVGLGDFKDESVQNFKFGKTEAYKGDVLVVSEKPGQEFQFYECDPPSDKYKDDQNKEFWYYGQLRSKDDPSMCVTPGYVYVKKGDYAWRNEPYPKHAEWTVRLQPCATKPSLEMRKQWFAMRKNLIKKGCSRVLKQVGWAKNGHDVEAPRLLYDQHDEHDQSVALGVTTRNYARIMMLGSDETKHECLKYPDGKSHD